MPDLAGRLLARTLELVDVPSESRDEAALAAHVLEVLQDAGVPARDAGDTCVLAGVTARGDRPLVLLAGHFDTVPAQDNRPGRLDEGAVAGLGASDMKGALAVMVELLRDGAGGAVDVGAVFFGREELPQAESALAPLLERDAGLRSADLAVVMEPTANALQLGCLGNIFATWTFRGRSGHSARPWLADNALHRAAHGVVALDAVQTARHEIGGLEYAEAVSATMLESGIASNVIPDLAVARVNYRYPPGMSAAEAEARLAGWCGEDGELEIRSNAPSGPVPEDNPLVEALRRTGDLAVAPKQAWTPVAEFGQAGIDAVNFGPGDPAEAHTRGEHVSAPALVASYEILDAFLRGA